jgi:hypothetical protein
MPLFSEFLDTLSFETFFFDALLLGCPDLLDVGELLWMPILLVQVGKTHFII